jgi:hypothetical protein
MAVEGTYSIFKKRLSKAKPQIFNFQSAILYSPVGGAAEEMPDVAWRRNSTNPKGYFDHGNQG